jgi:prepilin-type processing-associated H-X9-DG protein
VDSASVSRRGITLIQVIVAIVTLLLLGAVLIPMIMRVRQGAVAVDCLSNLRQLAAAHRQQLMESRTPSEPGSIAARGLAWIQVLKLKSGLPEEVYLCPAAADLSTDFGSATHSWSMNMRFPEGQAMVASSYGINGWLRREDQSPMPVLRWSGGTAEHFFTVNSPNPETIPVLGDATWQDGWPRADNRTPPNLMDGDRGRQGSEFSPNENMLARFTINRHDGAINIGFLDGHAEALKLGDLKRLRWHNGFVAQDWDPPLPALQP